MLHSAQVLRLSIPVLSTELSGSKKAPALLSVVVTLALVLVIFYFDFLMGRASFFIVDIYAYWQPFLTFIGNAFAEGRLPLWNPYCHNGISQLGAVAPSIFHAPYLLFSVLPFNPAYALLLISQQLAVAIGMYILVQSFGWGRWAAAFCALAMSLSGLMFSLETTPTLRGTLCWFIVA